jgi:hypothetical protein
MKSNKENTILDLVDKGLVYLKANYSVENGFAERCFYGETFTMATLSLLNKDAEWQKNLFKTYITREKSNPSNHEEFNFFALQEYLSFNPEVPIKPNVEESITLKFRSSFLRKVTNWVLLRNLVRIKSYRNLFTTFQINLVLKLNKYKNYITDNTLRSYSKRKNSLSSQYHAFANLLIGEIYEETKNTKYKELFIKNLELNIQEIKDNGEAITTGRGQKQIFGYAAFLYSLAHAYRLTKEERYLSTFNKVLDYVKSYQEESGKIPLVLSREENVQQYLYSYNNLFDYLPFLIFWLAKSNELIQE